ncbi:hypothetical protein [Taibaiella koreensis]|uniref:hypothetical protein n=1 Tax=Taibaiella koreensis TaxID=1268548 RepID=UPI000E599A7E|nr:hypothetical protein [Taibaiella koreensis]
MTQENNHNEQNGAATATKTAFEYLKELPRNLDRPAIASFIRGRESDILDYEIAEAFTDTFRNAATTSDPFFIPVSWTMTKTALLNLLGVESYKGFEDVNGVRFYAGVNADQQLTLVAVSTKAGLGCNDDLTINDAYPYYDYADPCPSNCSNSGNLKVKGGLAATLKVAALL